ncbi:hypothetical protein SAMN02746019_00006500, partial [Thermoflexus hugenholtzii JAD2]
MSIIYMEHLEHPEDSPMATPSRFDYEGMQAI